MVDDYPWDFCQIQYNYMDENYQAGKVGLKYASDKGLGIIIMEPLRGGTLVEKMPPTAQTIIKNFIPNKSPAEWALRFVWNRPEVTVLLSGMNVEEHIEENIKIASDALPNSLSRLELAMIDTVKKEFENNIKVPCTGCAYCIPCPHGVDIPYCFAMYNGKSMFGGIFPVYQYLSTTSSSKDLSCASQCKNCGICERHCPQHLPIRKYLNEVSATMEKPHYKIFVSIYRMFMYRNRGKKTKV